MLTHLKTMSAFLNKTMEHLKEQVNIGLVCELKNI